MRDPKSQDCPVADDCFSLRIVVQKDVKNGVQMLVYFENTFKKVAKIA